MAVFTKITDDEAMSFLADYELGAFQTLEGILQGVENTNYHVFTDQGRYILTIFESRIDESSLPFIFSFAEHLATQDITCPVPYHNKHDQNTGRIQGKPAALTKFLSGRDVNDENITVAHCTALGSYLARMHKAAESFTAQRENPVGMSAWQAFSQKTKARAHEVEVGLAELIDTELAALESEWPSDLPKGAVHVDLFPDNVFFEDYRLSGVIDFYFSCIDMFAYDLAVVVNAWCFDEHHCFQQDRYNALLAAYEDVRRLSLNEKQALPVLCRGAAIRFLMTRLNDWLFHPADAMVTPKDPKAYISRLKFFKDEYAQAC